MMKMKYLTIILIFLISCNSYNEQQLRYEVDSSLNSAIESSSNLFRHYSNIIERTYISNPPKGTQIWEEAKVILQLINNFRDILDDSLVVEISEIYEKYQNASDSLVKIGLDKNYQEIEFNKIEWSTKDYSSYLSLDAYQNILKRMMLENLISKANFLLDELVRKSFYAYEQEKNTTGTGTSFADSSAHRYSFYVDNKYFKHIPFLNHKLSIDSIMINGDLQKKENVIKKVDAIGIVNLATYKKGIYRIVGHIDTYDNKGYSYKLDFDHEFEKE